VQNGRKGQIEEWKGGNKEWMAGWIDGWMRKGVIG